MFFFCSVEDPKPTVSGAEVPDDTFQELFKAADERQFSFTKVYDKPSVKLAKKKKKMNVLIIDRSAYLCISTRSLKN